MWPELSVLSDPAGRCARVRAGGRSSSGSVSFGSGDMPCRGGGVILGDGGVDCEWCGERGECDA